MEKVDLERALFGAAVDGDNVQSLGAGQVSRPRKRLSTEEIEILLNNREELGHSAGYGEGWEAANAMWRRQQEIDITNAVAGTLKMVLGRAGLEQLAVRGSEARAALHERPRAKGSHHEVKGVLAGLIALEGDVRRLLEQVSSEGVRLP